jgi:hypothetical protein
VFNPDGTFKTFQWATAVGIAEGGWQMANLFGDGRQVYYTHSPTGWGWAARLNADGSFQTWTLWMGVGIGDGGWQPVDFLGEGRQKYWTHANSGAQWATGVVSAAPDLLSSIVNGLGSTTTVSYLPATAGQIYTKDSSSAYPELDVKFPMYLVSSVVQANGVGGTQAASFAYGGLKLTFDGRGLLGFRWQESTDQSTGLKARTEFRQDWPYVGMPSLVRKTQSSGAVLSESTSTYGCTNPATGAACTVAAGNRYFPFASQSVETGNDLNGAALPTVTTTMSYDAYGNATSIVVGTGDGYSKTTTNTFANDTANWFLGRLTRSTVQSTKP